MFHTRFNRIVSNVIIVGCGGTGSRLIPMVAQFMKSCPAILDPFITLIDGDKVEMKNLTRQNFIKPDVGRNKADVLAERYGSAIEIPIVSIPEYFEWDKDHDFCRWLGHRYGKLDANLANRAAGSPIVFFAVDSMRARLEILASIMYSRMRHTTWHTVMPIVIDAGNENTFGQVSVYHAVSAALNPSNCSTSEMGAYWSAMEFAQAAKKEYVGGDFNFPVRPAPIDMLLNSLTSPSAADVSCADLDQTAAINAQMAVAMFTAFQNVCLNHKMSILTSYYDIHNGNSQQKIDDWMLSMNEPKKTVGLNSNHIRGTFRMMAAREESAFKLPKDLDTMSGVLSESLVGSDCMLLRDMHVSMQKAIKAGEITKRNLELEALLNGRAA